MKVESERTKCVVERHCFTSDIKVAYSAFTSSFSSLPVSQELPQKVTSSHPTMADQKPNCKVILANNIAKSLLQEVQDGLKQIDRKPLLVGFLSSQDPAARVYADWTGKTANEK